MKNQGNQFEKMQVNVHKPLTDLRKESFEDTTRNENRQSGSKKLSARLQSFLENLDMSFRRIDAGLM